ncbi:phage protein [Clostridium hydrogeniformans]|uniref:phage protein n=1 Tax=Clostridium hydrogeniformans TaxID=349933 RepID=UPI00048292D7|nr:phage protein [Clostridium hydrogeniformans]
MYSTYSFEDVTCSFQHPGVGASSSTGAGLGSIAIAMANDKTSHDVAADGTVMISKIAGKNGTLTITMQQTSELHKYLLRWYNYVEIANSSEFAKMAITVKSNNLGDITTCTGVTPQKLADRPYQSQGQQVTWNLMSAEITQS